jgi:hypothetical protein
MSGDDPGPLGRLRAWLGSLFGGSDGVDEAEASETDPGAATAEESSTPSEPTPAPYVCTVCGTDVADPAGGCPLCGSSDVRERGVAATEPSGGPGPEPTATATESTVDGEASRLRELRDGSTDEAATSGDESEANEAE